MGNLDELLFSINAAVWHMNFPSRKFIYINQHFSDICGIALSELKQAPEKYNDLINPLDREQVFNEFKRVAEGLGIEIEYRIITDSGTKWIYHKEIMICDANGKQETRAGIISDITSRKESELKLIESERVYRYLFINNPNPLWIYDVNTLKFLAVNDAAVESYGYSREEFLSMTIADIRPEEDVTRLKEEIKKVDFRFKGRSLWTHLKKDGTPIRVNISSHGLIYQGHRASMVLITDLTDILNAQDELNITSNNLKALINNTPDLIYSIDTNYRLMSANEIFIGYIQRVFGIRLQIGDQLFLNTGEQKNYAVKWKPIYDRCLKGENFSLIDESQVNNRTMIHEIRFNTMYDDNGAIVGASCFIHDMTQHISNEREILTQNQRLREIASLASHDIRGHVTSILGLLTIMDKGDLSSYNAELMEYVQQAAEKLDSVIHKIVEKSSELTKLDQPYTWRSTKSMSE